MLPEDLRRVNRKTLEELFSTGNYSIDQEEQVRVNRTKRIRGYFVRPKRIKSSGELPKVFDPAIDNGNCVFWKPMDGCSLSHAERPWECRTLVPEIGECNKHCPPIRGDSRRFAARKWAPYENIIEEILREEKANGT
jgi:hypothetical protein